MAIIVGRQGRETSGVTLSTNSVAQVILESSGLELPADRLYIAPHGPNITVEGPNEIESIRQYESSLRLLWNRNHAIGELGQTMFAGYPAFKPQAGRPIIESGTNELSDMPSIKSPDDWISLTTRMRIVLEDARQLLSGCVTDYAAQQLRLHNDDPTAIVVPGLDNFDYPRGPRTPIYPCATPDGALNQTDGFMFTIDDLEIQTEFKFPCRKCVVDRGELAFWEEGSGSQAIIWIHGLPLASQSWGAQRRHFYKKNRNIYIDLRGYGESSKIPLDVQDVTNMHCADLRTLMDFLKLDRAHIVGFASAGHYALRFAAQSPERIDKLVAINGAALFRQRSDWPWGFSDEAIDKFTSAAARDGIEGMTNKILDPTVVFRDLSHSDAENVVRWFCQMSYKAGVQTLLSFFDHVSRDDDRHLMSSIDAPTLLISGLLGQEVPSQSGLYLRQEIPHARLVEVPDADHFLFITRPRVINQLVDGFLNSNSARMNT
jgi:non-heme chloroperoxidase